jgi:hypothetical protein
MHGSDMGTLSVEVGDPADVSAVSPCVAWSVLWSMTGEQQASTSASWTQAVVAFIPAVDNMAMRFMGVTGSSHNSDMCVDAVQLHVSG